MINLPPITAPGVLNTQKTQKSKNRLSTPSTRSESHKKTVDRRLNLERRLAGKNKGGILVERRQGGDRRSGRINVSV